MSRPALRDTVARRLGASAKRIDSLEREILAAGGGADQELNVRYVAFQKVLSPWAPGSFIPIDFSANAIISSNDAGLEQSWDTDAGPVLLEGDNFVYDSVADGDSFQIVGPGLFFVQMSAGFTAATGAFDVGFATNAGIAVLLDNYPVSMARYNANVADAGGASQASVGVERVSYQLGTQTASLSVYHNGAATFSLQNIVTISVAKLVLDAA